MTWFSLPPAAVGIDILCNDYDNSILSIWTLVHVHIVDVATAFLAGRALFSETKGLTDLKFMHD